MVSKKFSIIGIALCAMLWAVSCKTDVANTGISVLDEDDAIWVLADTFAIHSNIESGEAIISQADSFLLGEIETDYGLLRASILTQMACPEGYYYPENAELDSICLFIYYPSWVGDGLSPMAINAYMMDKGTFKYSGKYPTDLNIDDYCTRDKSILTNHRIIAASEKLDSVQNSSGTYIPALRMRVNDDFMDYFWAIKRFDTQEQFNQLFNGILLETSFGSSTVLNITDIALGVYFLDFRLIYRLLNIIAYRLGITTRTGHPTDAILLAVNGIYMVKPNRRCTYQSNARTGEERFVDECACAHD